MPKVCIAIIFLFFLQSLNADQKLYESIIDLDAVESLLPEGWEVSHSYLYDKVDKEETTRFVYKDIPIEKVLGIKIDYVKVLKEKLGKYGLTRQLDLYVDNSKAFQGYALSVFYFNSIKNRNRFVKKFLLGKDKKTFQMTKVNNLLYLFDSKIVKQRWVIYKSMIVRNTIIYNEPKQKVLPFRLLKPLQSIKVDEDGNVLEK